MVQSISFESWFQALVDEGDEVIIPSPYWGNISRTSKIFWVGSGWLVIGDIWTRTNFKITPEQVKKGL